MIFVVGNYKKCIATSLAFVVIMQMIEDVSAQVASNKGLAIVCRAAVAAMMGHDIKIVLLDKIEAILLMFRIRVPAIRRFGKIAAALMARP